MRTENSPSTASVVATLRAPLARARRALLKQGPALRWGLAIVAIAGLVLLGYLATPVSSSVAYVSSGQRYATDEVHQITRALAAKHIAARVDSQGRIEVASDRLDEATEIVAKLDVGPPIIERLRKLGVESSPFDLNGDKEQRRTQAKEDILAAMIRKLDGIVWAYVTINRPKPRGGYRPVPNPSAFVYLETEGDRAIGYKAVQSIQSLIVGAEPDLKHDAVTICDQTGRRYLDPFDPKLGVVSRTKAREEELGQEIHEQLDCIKGVRVTVQLIAPPVVRAPATSVPPPPPLRPTMRWRCPSSRWGSTIRSS